MNIENSPTDRKLIVLEAYILPFKSIKKAKEKYCAEINARIESLEKIIERGTPLQKSVLDAIKNGNDIEYNDLMLKIKEYYEPKSVESLQSGIIQIISKALSENIKPKERPTEPIKVPEQVKEKITEQIAKPAEKPQEKETEKATNIADMPRREYYQSLAQKYSGKMYEIREKITENKATQEEMYAWFANFVQDLAVIKKRKNTEDLVREERNFLKEHLQKWINKNIMSAYYKELKELGIWKDI